jgi:thiol-disulfide isomerase/thioredoxin
MVMKRRHWFWAFALVLAIGTAHAESQSVRKAPAPGFAEGGPWFGTGDRPLTIEQLRGRVIGVDMWVAGCINCLNTLPHLKRWDAKYRDRGFVLIGVHAPEFPHQTSTTYVRNAIDRLGIRYAVVMDNDFRIWRAYRNAYWPTLYLVDKQGRLRYRRIGEGAYQETEREIEKLLKESS